MLHLENKQEQLLYLVDYVKYRSNLHVLKKIILWFCVLPLDFTTFDDWDIPS